MVGQARAVARRGVSESCGRPGPAAGSLNLGLGLAGSYALATTVSGLLDGVNPRDPLTFGGMAAFLLVIGLIGCLVPARRATAVNPLSALEGGIAWFPELSVGDRRTLLRQAPE